MVYVQFISFATGHRPQAGQPWTEVNNRWQNSTNQVSVYGVMKNKSLGDYT
jgi:hypothetical protein